MKLFSLLAKIVATSVKRNGPDKPLTIGWLSNILQMTLRAYVNAEVLLALEEDKWEAEFWEDEGRYGSGD